MTMFAILDMSFYTTVIEEARRTPFKASTTNRASVMGWSGNATFAVPARNHGQEMARRLRIAVRSQDIAGHVRPENREDLAMSKLQKSNKEVKKQSQQSAKEKKAAKRAKKHAGDPIPLLSR